jgi:hypothetical protein
MRRRAWLLAVVLAGCGGGSAAPKSSTPAPSGAIEFRWSGTIIGRDDTLRIAPDGSATLQTRDGKKRTLDIPAPVVAHVREDLASADLPSLKDHYEGPMVSDGSIQTITAGGRTVQDDNGGGPPQLDRVVEDLTNIVAYADYAVVFRMGIRTTIGPDLASIEIGQDGTASIHTPNTGNTSAQLTAKQMNTLRAALDATPFEADGAPGFVDSRAPLDEGQVTLVYRWLTLKDPPAVAKPAVTILRGLL